ncbi:hypothetical protein JCM3770_005134 [Rhodotorula araucariae]
MSFSFGAPAAKPAATTFSFGAPAASAPSTTPSLFGAAPTSQPATTSLFGAAQPTTSLFGSAAPAPTSQPLSLFGGGQPAPSLFGASSAAPPSGGLFGASTAAPATGGGLFGASAQVPASAGGPFGQQQQPQPAQQPAPSLFGQSQSAASLSLFSSKPATSSLFGSTAAGGLTAPGGPAPPAAAVPKLGDPLPVSPNEPAIEARLQALKDAWDPSSPRCRFQAYFYNELPAGHSREMYARPAPGADESRWERARRENPEPERLVPALALGFPALEKRIAAQALRASQHAALLGEIHAHLAGLSSTHSLTTSLRTLRAQQSAVALHARLTALVARAQALAPGRGASVREDEDALRVRLERMRAEVDRARARVGELWAGVGAVKARRQDDEAVEWAVSDDEGLRRVLEILSSQQAGLDHLSRTVRGMASDVDVMNAAFGLAPTRVAGIVVGGDGRQ